MNTLRAPKRSEYVIEVNDAGETISFNMEDPSLYLRASKVIDEIRKVESRHKSKIVMIEKKEDKMPKGAILSNNQKAIMQEYDEMYKEMRVVMDGFLGEGACMKIFGSANYITMYDELFEVLQPHFDKMGLSAKNTIDYIKGKYKMSGDDDVIEVS